MEITWHRTGGSVTETIEHVLYTECIYNNDSLLMPRSLGLPGPTSHEFQWPLSLHGSSSDKSVGSDSHPQDSLPVKQRTRPSNCPACLLAGRAFLFSWSISISHLRS